MQFALRRVPERAESPDPALDHPTRAVHARTLGVGVVWVEPPKRLQDFPLAVIVMSGHELHVMFEHTLLLW